ncbi:MAG: hypothetical protein GX540_04405 [Clostridiales bacterium]|nr:hypothetical protein [Clostridiales bacterium]
MTSIRHGRLPLLALVHACWLIGLTCRLFPPLAAATLRPIAARPTAGMAPISEERLQEIIDEAVAAIRAEAAKNDKKPKE